MSVKPLAMMPEMCCALPALNALAPETTSSKLSLTPTGAAPIFGLRVRSHARRKHAAVTGLPSLNLSPGRMWNVYVLPPFETAGNEVAASGYNCWPAFPFCSGKFTSSSWVVYSIDHEVVS